MIMLRKEHADELPEECLSLGFAGYEAAGFKPPREGVWKGHVAERLHSCGCFLINNVSGTIVNGLPDTTLHSNCGIVFLEFKGLNSPVRLNQALAAKTYNSKSFYSRGELCAFVYRAPDILGFLRPDGEVVEITRVDALSDPEGFMSILHKATQPVVRGTPTNLITKLVDQVGLVRLPIKNFRVVFDGAVDTAPQIQTYSAGLALKQLTGLTPLTAIATYGSKSFDCEVIEVTCD